MADTTTIQITKEQWASINGAKEEPGESMKDVVGRLIEVFEEVDQKGIELDCLADDGPTAEEIASEHQTFDEVADREREKTLGEKSRDEQDVGAVEETDAEGEPVTGAQRAAIEDAIDAVAETWDDEPDRIEKRKDAARAAAYYLVQKGGASKKQVKEAVEPTAPVDGQNPRTWYRKNVREVFNQIAEYDSSAREYQYTGGRDE